jgi:hypothetical protein
MSTKIYLLVVSVCFLGWSIVDASVTSIPTWNYGGGFYCYAPVLSTDSGTGAQSLGITGTQSSLGSLGLSILTDTVNDPTLTINESINNQSSFAWTGYILNVSMDQSFSINSAGVIAPSGWTATITAPSGPVAGIYTGTIDFTSGTPVGIFPGPDSTLNFGYQVTFSGSTQYTLTESANPVPEPGASNLLMAGGLLVSGSMAAKRRFAKRA